ncbi:LysE family transporter [Enterovibrio sp. ZSDZ35]|uniref:LysE family transporter n=1 Tax=Enterovibrio qingdaonensis TaxID=2899818 RepID=A0ABT5QHL0_9GAMM|nr:LysE family transporter [Enterovibrio sp. ZSDZ35]MDD1780334.1 LysE family transporter [Enterovibrio sp. ZSDZ35]
MLELWAYAIGIMYSPGPVNLLGLHGGVQRKTRQNLGYFAGVSSAMFILFVVMSLLGGSLITASTLPYVSVVGCAYILYIAIKLFRSDVSFKTESADTAHLTYVDGLLLQLLNPKGYIATLPIVTIQFPAAGISGFSSLFWIGVLTVLAFGAPASYSIVGAFVGQQIEKPIYFRIFTVLMSLLLVYVAFGIAYQHIYLTWFA